MDTFDKPGFCGMMFEFVNMKLWFVLPHSGLFTQVDKLCFSVVNCTMYSLKELRITFIK